jgi:hypothetical protein
MYQFVLHHVVGDSRREALSSLNQALAAGWQRLVPAGTMIIVEDVLAEPLYPIERLLFPLIQRILTRADVSMIYSYSNSVLMRALSRATGIDRSQIDITNIRLRGWFDLLGGSFPGKLIIPHWALPYRVRLLMVTKV